VEKLERTKSWFGEYKASKSIWTWMWCTEEGFFGAITRSRSWS